MVDISIDGEAVSNTHDGREELPLGENNHDFQARKD